MHLVEQVKEVSEAIGSDGVTKDTSALGQKITAAGLLNMLRSQGHLCALTGRPIIPETASLDHIVPLSRGGSNVIENCQIVHREANQVKSTLTNGEFFALCREVITWIDRK